MRENEHTDSTRPVKQKKPNPGPAGLIPHRLWTRRKIIRRMKISPRTFDLWVAMGLHVTTLGTDYLWAYTDDIIAMGRTFDPAKAKSLRAAIRAAAKAKAKKPKRKRGGT